MRGHLRGRLSGAGEGGGGGGGARHATGVFSGQLRGVKVGPDTHFTYRVRMY